MLYSAQDNPKEDTQNCIKEKRRWLIAGVNIPTQELKLDCRCVIGIGPANKANL